MKCIKIKPMEFPEVVEIENKLESFQLEVDGRIECIGLEYGVDIICNDEGKIMGLPLNRTLKDEYGRPYDIVAGNFLIVGVDMTEGEFCDLTDEQLEKYLLKFKYPEIFIPNL